MTDNLESADCKTCNGARQVWELPQADGEQRAVACPDCGRPHTDALAYARELMESNPEAKAEYERLRRGRSGALSWWARIVDRMVDFGRRLSGG